MFRTRTEQDAAGRRRPPAPRRRNLTALAVAVATAAGGTVLGITTTDATSATGSDDVRVVAGRDASMSSVVSTGSASDWVTHGEHAAVVEMVPGSERRGTPQEDTEKSGEGHIPRTGTMKVREVLWSRPGAEPLPGTYAAELLGWWWDGDSEQEFAWRGEPRFEEGHTYIVLLVRYDGGWDPMDTMPYDDGKVGTGEVAGRVRSGSPGEELEGLAEKADGGDAALVGQLLNAAEPRT